MSWFPWDILFRFPLAILLSVICSCLSLVSGLYPWISTGPGGRWVEPCSMPQCRRVGTEFPKFYSWSLDQTGRGRARQGVHFSCALRRDLSAYWQPKSPTHQLLSLYELPFWVADGPGSALCPEVASRWKQMFLVLFQVTGSGRTGQVKAGGALSVCTPQRSLRFSAA